MAKGTFDKVQVNCSCGLENNDTANVGYCKDVIGTDPYIKYSRQIYYMLVNSNCHTLDRHDIRAQRDGCGIGIINEEWRFAVSLRFNVTHWPYIHTTENYHCV